MYSLFWGLIYGPVIPKGGGLVKLNRPYLFQQKKASTMRPIYCDNSYLLVNLFRKYRLVSYSFIVTAYICKPHATFFAHVVWCPILLYW